MMAVPDIVDVVHRLDRLDTRVDTAEARRGARIDAAEARMRAHAEVLAAETRRHFDVVAEGMMSKIQLLAEGIRAVDQKLDRFRDEVRVEFARIDQRFLRVEARLDTLARRML
jgi:hypothetical protein